MDKPKPTTLPDERVFTFISDPQHKENLSGRVQAACIACRRKKIKCSGGFNCASCQEKGLLCEGPPKRKRLRRESSSFLEEDAEERKRKFSSGKQSHLLTDPVSLLRSADLSESVGSGYGSSCRASTGALLRPKKRPLEESASPIETTFPKLAPTPFRVNIWEFGSSRDSSDPSTQLELASTSRPRSEHLHIKSEAPLPAAPAHVPHVSTTALDGADEPSDELFRWHNDPSNGPPQLLGSRSQLLMGAQPYIQHIPMHVPINTNNNQNHYQAVYPSMQPPQNPTCFDMLPNQPGIFDEMASLLAAGQPPRAGPTPGAVAEYTPWWDDGSSNAVIDHASATLSSEQQLLHQQPQQQLQPQLNTGINPEAQDVKLNQYSSAAYNDDLGEAVPGDDVLRETENLPSITIDRDRMPRHEESFDTATARRASVGNFYW